MTTVSESTSALGGDDVIEVFPSASTSASSSQGDAVSATPSTAATTSATPFPSEPLSAATTVTFGADMPASSETTAPTSPQSTVSSTSGGIRASRIAALESAESAASASASESSRLASGSQEASATLASSTTLPTQTTSDYGTNASETPTPMSQDSKDNSGGLSTGAQAGIGAACGLLGLAALLVLAFVLMKKRKGRQLRKPELQDGDFSDDPKAKAAPMVQDYVPFAELEAREVKQEMPASFVYPVELEGARTRGG